MARISLRKTPIANITQPQTEKQAIAFDENGNFGFKDELNVWTEVKKKGHKIFRAIISQEGTNAPVATILENTLGTITFARIGAGFYHATSTNLFTVGKTVVKIGSANDGDHSSLLFTAAAYASTGSICTFLTSTAYAELLQDGGLSNVYFEIEVYP